MSAAFVTCLTLALTGAPVRGGLGAAVLALALRPSSLILGLSPDSVRRFRWTGDGEWSVRRRRGSWEPAQLLQSTTLWGPLILLAWRTRLGRSYVLLDAVSTDPHRFRLLRGRLRLEAGSGRRALDGY